MTNMHKKLQQKQHEKKEKGELSEDKLPISSVIQMRSFYLVLETRCAVAVSQVPPAGNKEHFFCNMIRVRTNMLHVNKQNERKTDSSALQSHQDQTIPWIHYGTSLTSPIFTSGPPCGTEAGQRFMCGNYTHPPYWAFFLLHSPAQGDDKFLEVLKGSTGAEPPVNVGHLICTLNQVGIMMASTNNTLQAEVHKMGGASCLDLSLSTNMMEPPKLNPHLTSSNLSQMLLDAW